MVSDMKKWTDTSFFPEDIYIKDYERVAKLQSGMATYFRFYDEQRPHQSLGYWTPAEVYRPGSRIG